RVAAHGRSPQLRLLRSLGPADEERRTHKGLRIPTTRAAVYQMKQWLTVPPCEAAIRRNELGAPIATRKTRSLQPTAFPKPRGALCNASAIGPRAHFDTSLTGPLSARSQIGGPKGKYNEVQILELDVRRGDAAVCRRGVSRRL